MVRPQLISGCNRVSRHPSFSQSQQNEDDF
jgi:hypothetical protein